MTTRSSLDKVIGTLLVGSYANSILYTLEVIAVVQYYLASKRNNQDSRWLQALVYFELLTDTISTLSNDACVYFYSVTHWGDPNYAQIWFWPSSLSLAVVGISETLVQYFLIYRYWVMSNNKFITLILCIFVFAEAGGCVLCIYLFNLESFDDRRKLVVSTIIWFSMSAAVDTFIALALVWEFSKIKSPFKATQSLIHNLVASTVRTGAITSVVAILILVLFLTDDESNASIAVMFCFGRVYALTMLYNLNNRSRHGGSTSHNNDMANTTNMVNEIIIHTSVFSETKVDQDTLEVSDSSKSNCTLAIASLKSESTVNVG